MLTCRLRRAKRAQRRRERQAGLTNFQIRLPVEQVERLRVATNAPGFRTELDRFLDETAIEIERWPALRELARNRADRWIPAEDAFGLYERNWRFVDRDRMTDDEAALVERLKRRFGAAF